MIFSARGQPRSPPRWLLGPLDRFQDLGDRPLLGEGRKRNWQQKEVRLLEPQPASPLWSRCSDFRSCATQTVESTISRGKTGQLSKDHTRKREIRRRRGSRSFREKRRQTSPSRKTNGCRRNSLARPCRGPGP